MLISKWIFTDDWVHLDAWTPKKTQYLSTHILYTLYVMSL